MEKDQNIDAEKQVDEPEEITPENEINEAEQNTSNNTEEIKETSPEEKILDLEDKVARAFAEMENQRRRFEKEREDAFNYGGFAFAKETLNLLTQPSMNNARASRTKKQRTANQLSTKNVSSRNKIPYQLIKINKDSNSIQS